MENILYLTNCKYNDLEETIDIFFTCVVCNRHTFFKIELDNMTDVLCNECESFYHIDYINFFNDYVILSLIVSKSKKQIDIFNKQGELF